MKIGATGWAFWVMYFAFTTTLWIFDAPASALDFSGSLGGLKALVWLALIAFLVYSFFCTTQENLFRSVRSIAQLHWGRQIGIDLYLGLFIGLILIYLNQGALAVAIWLVPTLIYANQIILFYMAMHFDEIAARFMTL